MMSQPDSNEVAGGNAAGAVTQEGAESENPAETVQEPAKLVRLARMIHELLSEVREADLDEETRQRLRSHVEQTADEVGDVLSPDLREELSRLRTRWSGEGGSSQSELRVEQAQLAGWLEGVLQGIQTALSLEQASNQQGLDQLRGSSQQG